jgi:hypothetical protein
MADIIAFIVVSLFILAGAVLVVWTSIVLLTISSVKSVDANSDHPDI